MSAKIQIGLVVLGSILAFSGGLVAFFIQWWWNQCKQRTIVITFIKEILRDYDRICPRIIETFEKSGTLWNDLLHQVADSLSLYERNKEHTIALKDGALRAEVWDWFSKTRTIVNNFYALNSMISNLNNPQLAEWARNEIKQKVPQLGELRKEAKTLIEKLA